MKNKLIITLIFIFIGCNSEKNKNIQISSSKSSAISNAIEIASPGIVGIYKEQDIKNFNSFFISKETITSVGTGFFINSDGYILSNAHNIELIDNVVTTEYRLNVVVPGGKVYDAEFIAFDSMTDIALLKIEGENFEYCNLGDSDDIKVGEWVVALGNPNNLISNVQYQPIATAGIISAVNVDLNFQKGKLLDNMIQTDAAINPGNSGGPLIDSDGNVIGINTFISEGQNLGFAIPINFAMKIAQELKVKGAIDRRVSFGFDGRLIRYGSDKSQIGIIVDKVDYNDSAINEELYRGDIIIAVEGIRINSMEEFNLVLNKFDKRAGDSIKLSVIREGVQKTIKFTLGVV
jgi:serine protease Do